MINLTALIAILDTDPRYDANVRGGHNSRLVTQINDDLPLSPVWHSIPADEFLNAVVGDSLTTEERDLINTYVGQGSFPLDQPAIRDWVTTTMSAATFSMLQSSSFTSDRVGLQDIRVAVSQVSKSYIRQRA